MIGMVTKGGSFYGCISYCLEDKRGLSEEQKRELSIQEGVQHKNRAEVLEYNNCYGDKRELAGQFRDVGKLSKQVEKPVLHLAIRVAPGDHLTKGQLIEVGQAAAKEFGLDKNQYVCILHKDTKEQHVHVVGNRVGYDGKVANDSHSYRRMADLCRRLEKKYGLKEVLNPRKFQSQKERQIPRLDQRKVRLKENIRNALKGSKSYQEFEKKMQQIGYRVEKGRGIAFEDDKKVRIKGSEVNYSLQTIQNILERQRMKEIRQTPAYRQGRKGKIQKARAVLIRGMDKRIGLFPDFQIGADLKTEIVKGLGKLMAELLKPEHMPEQVPWELRMYRPRKKKKSHYLHL